MAGTRHDTQLFTPFANEADALSVGELSVENHTDRVTIFGNLEITRGAAGLQQAKALKMVLDAVVAALESGVPATDDVPAATVKKVVNPFGE
ncbi:hypothetical protein PTE30175_03612 [Pandoraea terrae]|uniref:Uncharacterized protein n=1 Tax=Pandoraea terrae TaxID=1537710 RepID=A0A5E4X7F9_9BURK|nr:hypothetical protein [Pandoraea terrae]VVE32130.1 hypothetical protein PTE30175_03612 [Pandoraea terrae]